MTAVRLSSREDYRTTTPRRTNRSKTSNRKSSSQLRVVSGRSSAAKGRSTHSRRSIHSRRSTHNRRRRLRLTPLGRLAIVSIVTLLLVLIVGSFPRMGSRKSSDKVCYLAAKYESEGHAESVGDDVKYQAYGEYQLYYRYELVPFVNWCYEKDPKFYAAFEPFLEMSRYEIPGKEFRVAWKQLAADNYKKFEEDQQDYLIENTMEEACAALTQEYGYDFTHADDAVKACVLSIANRDGKYIENLRRIFHSTTKDSSAEEIINSAYSEMQFYRPSEQRWVLEKEDCLAMLHGTLNIYKKSENDAGGIDWRWKE